MSPDDLLRLAVDRGLITEAQRASILALGAESGPWPREVPRGFNWVTVAYVLGASLVVFAGGWFLAQRWLTLGPSGVLAIVLAYVVAAALASRWLRTHEFPEAAGIAATVAVSLTPVAVWALESLTGWWPVETWGQPYHPQFPAAEASRWVVAELATILAALLVLRRRMYTALGFPIAVALFGLVNHVPRSLDVLSEEPLVTPVLERWLLLSGALLVCAVADTVDRRVSRGTGSEAGDFAFPLWTVGLIALGSAILAFWPTAGLWRHGTPVLALGAIAAALVLGRRSHLVFGVLALFMYLLWLAAEVFRSTAYFPVALAGLGALLLFATVWLQRRFPSLATRLGARRGGTGGRRGGLPGTGLVPWVAAVGALGITAASVPEAREEREDRAFQQRLHILRLHSGSRRGPPARAGEGPRAEPPAPPPER